jgi:metal-dependent amidase/aminoacylase/carboxypeptidase family protein
MQALQTREGPHRRPMRTLVVALCLALVPVIPAGPTAPRRAVSAGQQSKGADQSAPAAIKEDVARVKKHLAADYERLEKLYKHLHANPELSLREVRTAARMAQELSAAGCAVTEKVGGYGVVGVFRNGDGPTVLVRADMDGLPIEEKTGLPYASKVRTRDKNDHEVGVMHACGHDVNMTCCVGTASVLIALKEHWKGTVVLIVQPPEGIGPGGQLKLHPGL